MVRFLLQTRHNFIAPMEWEAQVQQAAGLTLDQTRFALSFLACIIAGILIRLLRSPTCKTHAACSFGAGTGKYSCCVFTTHTHLQLLMHACGYCHLQLKASLLLPRTHNQS